MDAELDTGRCVAETLATLMAQQRQLLAGRRIAQMFPTGTLALALPDGLARHQNQRGVFHYRRDRLSAEAIEACSRDGRENEILLLGPYSKPDIARRVAAGERACCITEYRPDGVELRSAVGTTATAQHQLAYFEATKDHQANAIVVGDLLAVLAGRLAKRGR
jgi:hypothetical protein